MRTAIVPLELDIRSLARRRHHFEVERELALRLQNSSRSQRSALYRTLYEELFHRVPDHPRLMRRDTAALCQEMVAAQMALLRGQLAPHQTFVEFAPGDAALAFEVCQHVRQVIAADISDQTGGRTPPSNFKLVLYDGYSLDLPDNSADLAFSYQFIEHLHPEDVTLHFQLVRRILRPGGHYIFSTPHRFSGPHDISAEFSDTPQGFHLKEWTFNELSALIQSLGFSAQFTYRCGAPRRSTIMNHLTFATERSLGVLPHRVRRALSRRLFQGVTMILRK